MKEQDVSYSNTTFLFVNFCNFLCSLVDGPIEQEAGIKKVKKQGIYEDEDLFIPKEITVRWISVYACHTLQDR